MRCGPHRRRYGPDLRNKGGEIVDRAVAGEEITITRNGEPVAELRPIGRRRLSTPEIMAKWAHLAPVDPQRFRDDIDELFDTSL